MKLPAGITSDGLGVRQIIVPGAPHPIRWIPAAHSMFGVIAAQWPARDPHTGEWIRRGARMDWHRAMAKREIAELLNPSPKETST